MVANRLIYAPVGLNFGIRKVKLRGLLNVNWLLLMTAAAFNLWRIPKLSPTGA